MRRWEAIMEASPDEKVYAHSWYLDACAGKWGALVGGDYEFLMPLAFGRKWGIRYLFQPRFCQQLGVYAGKEVDQDIVHLFLLELGRKFPYGDYAFQEGNFLQEESGFELSSHTNYTLKLHASYLKLRTAYSTNCRRNVQKALDSGLQFSKNIPVAELVQLKREHDHRPQSDNHYQDLTDMFRDLRAKGHIRVFGVESDQKLCAGAIFAYSRRRIHYLLSVSTAEGKERSAMFLLMDRMIQKYAGQDLILDFEGSEIPSIARFFQGFGASPQSYQRIRIDTARSRILAKLRGA